MTGQREKIKVVFGINDLAVGGMERQFVEQVRHFNRETFEIVLVTLFQFPESPDLYGELPPDLEVRRLHFRSATDLHSWHELYGVLRELRPDIVVSSLFFSNTVFRILAPLVGYRSIAREHNTYTDKPAFHQLVDRVLARVSYRIVAVSETVATFTAAQEGIARAKFLVIRNGVDVAHMRSRLATLPPKGELQEAMGFSSSDRVLLNIARLVPQKKHRLLVDGFLLFRTSHPTYKLAVVSGGGLRDELEAYLASVSQTQGATAGNAVIFFGHRDDFWKFYAFADALVSTSAIEGLSNAMLEALAAGVPLVATKTAGTDEILHDAENGFFIDDPTPEGVRAALEKFVAADRAHLKERALEYVQAYDIKETVRAYEALFRGAARAAVTT